jgi:hypothetical protein
MACYQKAMTSGTGWRAASTTGSTRAFDLLAEIGRDCVGALEILPRRHKLCRHSVPAGRARERGPGRPGTAQHDCRASSRARSWRTKTTSMSTDRRGMSCTKRVSQAASLRRLSMSGSVMF